MILKGLTLTPWGTMEYERIDDKSNKEIEFVQQYLSSLRERLKISKNMKEKL